MSSGSVENIISPESGFNVRRIQRKGPLPLVVFAKMLMQKDGTTLLPFDDLVAASRRYEPPHQAWQLVRHGGRNPVFPPSVPTDVITGFEGYFCDTPDQAIRGIALLGKDIWGELFGNKSPDYIRRVKAFLSGTRFDPMIWKSLEDAFCVAREILGEDLTSSGKKFRETTHLLVERGNLRATRTYGPRFSYSLTLNTDPHDPGAFTQSFVLPSLPNREQLSSEHPPQDLRDLGDLVPFYRFMERLPIVGHPLLRALSETGAWKPLYGHVVGTRRSYATSYLKTQ